MAIGESPSDGHVGEPWVPVSARSRILCAPCPSPVRATDVPVPGCAACRIRVSCTLLGAGMTAPPSTQLLAIELIANGIGMAPGPGTYTLGTTQNVAII